MSTELTTSNGTGSNLTWTKEQEKLILDTICKNATPDEAKLFFYRAKNMGLDPLKPGQIHFVKYGTSAGSIVVGIEGCRAIAHRSGLISGISRGVLKDEKGRLVGGWCEVRRKDWTHPAREEVAFDEYNTGKSAWAKMPETMIKKVAEAAALRMAFPEALGGAYIPEEMEQGKPVVGNQLIRADDPLETGDGIAAPGERIPTHLDPRLAVHTYETADPEILREVIANVEKKYADAKKPLPPKALEFIEKASAAIATWEGKVTAQMRGE